MSTRLYSSNTGTSIAGGCLLLIILFLVVLTISTLVWGGVRSMRSGIGYGWDSSPNHCLG